jgi:hypothetical protein
MAKVLEIDEFVKKSSLVIKRTPDQKISVQGDFVYKSARYELSGQIDTLSGKTEPFHSKLSWGQAVIFEEVSVFAGGRTHREYSFGKATNGVRLLVVNSERMMGGAMVTGFADGRELLPYFRPRHQCSCDDPKKKPPRPLLVWGEGASTRPVGVSVPAKAAPELEGLAKVMERMAEQSQGGGGGDVGDIQWFICYINCTFKELWCILRGIFLPSGETFILICLGIYGDCFDWCWTVGTI